MPDIETFTLPPRDSACPPAKLRVAEGRPPGPPNGFRRFFPLLICIALLFPSAAFAKKAKKEKEIVVQVEGIQGDLLENVLAHLSLEHPTAPINEERVRQFYRVAPDEIGEGLKALGYYHSKTESTLEKADRIWIARFKIDPGPPVIVEKVDLRLIGEGDNDGEFKSQVLRFPPKIGERLNQEKYEEAKQHIQGLATERGYFDARFTDHEIRLDIVKNVATLVLIFETGRRYHLGPVRFEQDEFELRFLERFVRFKPGEPYHAQRLLELNNDLSASGYFLTIDIVPEHQSADLSVPLDVRLAARKKYEFTAGLGYGTDTGPRATFGWENRRFNRLGHRFNTELELSQIRQSATATYEIPMDQPPTEKMVFNAGIRRDDTKTSLSETGIVGVSRTYELPYGWLETPFLNYQYEKFEVGEQHGKTKLILPGVTWTRTKADSPSRPRRGYRVTLTLQGTNTWLGSDLRLLQEHLQGKLIQPLGAKGRILLRTDLGNTAVSDFSRLPASLRYFAGGDRSVRGYAYQSQGPVGPDGHVIGGPKLMVGSVEYDHPVVENWSGAVFYDIGNAVNRFNQFDTLKESVGFGVRWYSPVGPIRVDLAFPVGQSGFNFRVHINMGPDL